MREALAGLTVRGRAFLAAGVTAIVCAVVLGQPALARVGVLVVALPLVTVAVLARTRYRLALVRSVSPQVVEAGQSAQVTLALTNEGRTPTGSLLLEDHVPYVLGTRPRFLLEGVGHGWRREVSYQVRSDIRGRFEVGPMTVRQNDPFGLVELGRAFRSSVSLTVTPRTVALSAIPLGGGWNGSGDNRPRAFALGSAEDVTVREYRRGDDLRRVHWRSSARFGELMVRREEQPWQSRATVVLDDRTHAHRGQGIASSLETAVTAAASIAVHLSRRGYQVHLVTTSGRDPGALDHQRDTDVEVAHILETLALVESVDRVRIDTSWMGEHKQGGLTIAVLGQLVDDDVAILRRLQQHTTTALALVLDVDGWAGGAVGASAPGSPDHPSALAEVAGWRATTLRTAQPLDQAWSGLGRAAHLSAGVTP